MSSARAPGTAREQAAHPDEHRLPAVTELGFDDQQPTSLRHQRIAPAHHISLQRGEARLAVALEKQGARFVQPVDIRLPGTLQ